MRPHLIPVSSPGMWHAANFARLVTRQLEDRATFGYVTVATQREIDYWNEWARSMSAATEPPSFEKGERVGP